MAGSDYYDHTTYPSTGAAGSSSAMRAELDLIETGFGKLPALAAGNANKAVIGNGTSGLTYTTGTLALAGNFATSGSSALTLTTTGATNVTLPTTGTLVTTSNKLSAFAATSSAELRGVISDETGTGALVFAEDPTFTLSDVTTNNVSASAHGWCPKLSGNTTTFLRGDGTFATPPSGLVYLSTVTASASSTIDIETTFDSTYYGYLIIGVDIIPSTGIDLSARLKVAGAYDTSANYRGRTTSRTYANTTVTEANQSGTTSVLIAQSLVSTARTHLHVEILGDPTVSGASQYKSFKWELFTSIGVMTRGHGALIVDGALTGFRLLPSTGNIASGNFYLFGISKS